VAVSSTQIDLSWLGRRRTAPLPLTPLPRDEGFRHPAAQLRPAPIAVAPCEVPDVLAARESRLAVVDEIPPVHDALVLDDISFPALDLDVMKQRYPALRTAL